MDFDQVLDEAINELLDTEIVLDEGILKKFKIFEDEQRGLALRTAFKNLMRKHKMSGQPLTALDFKMELAKVWPQGANDPEVLSSVIEAFEAHGGKMA